MNGNAIAAGATANAGTSSVGLAANTIDNSYDSDDGAGQSVDNSGAFLSSNRGNVASSDEEFLVSAGTSVLNSQRTVGGDGSSTVDALLSNNLIQLFVNAHPDDSSNPQQTTDNFPGSGDSIDGSSFEISGNLMEAAAGGNSFASAIDHDLSLIHI